MRTVPGPLVAALGIAGLVVAAVACAGPAESVRVIAADDGGVTLRIELPAWTLRAGDASGRSILRAGTLPESDVPGRPGLPFAVALVGIPPRASVSAAVVGGDPEQLRQGVHLLPGGKPSFVDGGR